VYQYWDCVYCFTGLTIDTTTLNDTTWHKLFIRTDSFVGNDDPLLVSFNAGKAANKKIGGGTFSAVTLVLFRTNNSGAAPADPLPAPGDGSGDGCECFRISGSCQQGITMILMIVTYQVECGQASMRKITCMFCCLMSLLYQLVPRLTLGTL
jgi:hypothetical protein